MENEIANPAETPTVYNTQDHATTLSFGEYVKHH